MLPIAATNQDAKSSEAEHQQADRAGLCNCRRRVLRILRDSGGGEAYLLGVGDAPPAHAQIHLCTDQHLATVSGSSEEILAVLVQAERAREHVIELVPEGQSGGPILIGIDVELDLREAESVVDQLDDQVREAAVEC